MGRTYGEPSQAADGIWHYPYTDDETGEEGEDLSTDPPDAPAPAAAAAAAAAPTTVPVTRGGAVADTGESAAVVAATPPTAATTPVEAPAPTWNAGGVSTPIVSPAQAAAAVAATPPPAPVEAPAVLPVAAPGMPATAEVPGERRGGAVTDEGRSTAVVARGAAAPSPSSPPPPPPPPPPGPGADAATTQAVFNMALELARQSVAAMTAAGLVPRMQWNAAEQRWEPTEETVPTLARIRQQFDIQFERVRSIIDTARSSGRAPRIQLTNDALGNPTIDVARDAQGNPLFDETLESRRDRLTAARQTGYIPTELTGAPGAPAPAAPTGTATSVSEITRPRRTTAIGSTLDLFR